jgi:hypothetical protein
MKRIAPLALVLLFGCGTSAAVQQAREEYFRTIPMCSSKPECDAKWEAAQLWAATRLPLKVQTVTNVMIQTYNPPPYGTETAALITKESTGNGAYRFGIRTWCNNMIQCFPGTWDAALDFNRFVNAAPTPAS